MIDVTKLCRGLSGPGDSLRFSRKLPPPAERRPVVVFNCTRRCNLQCRHCYSHSGAACEGGEAGELTTAEASAMIDDLAAFGSPVLLFSGGEPMLRGDLCELAARASAAGMRTVLSTNGTMIDPPAAEALKRAGLGYVGISLDGLEATHDRFRQRQGAFSQTLAGIRNCRAAGLRVGLRLTVSRRNVDELDDVFDLVAAEGIDRVCIYHLVYSGRGAEIQAEDLDHAQTRAVMDRILDRSADFAAAGRQLLTVDNHADGPYLLMRLVRDASPLATRAAELLNRGGGNSSGCGIGCVSWDGSVHPDQFWRSVTLGNIRRRPFSQIWTDLSNPVMARLKSKADHVKGRCRRCAFLGMCGGNLRARAEACGDAWGEDPACYLSDEEIAQPLKLAQPTEAGRG